MDNFQIETAQNVSISQQVAPIGDRIFAYLVDGIIMVFYAIVVLLITRALGLNPYEKWSYMLILGFPLFLYFLLWETFWDGKTPGKHAMHIRVVKLDGSVPDFSNYVVRWLLRTIDITLGSGGIAIVVILMNGKGQRLGDLAAGTTVISEKPRAKLSDTILVDIPENYQPQYPQVTVFDDAEMRKIKTIYTDAKEGADHHIIVALSQKVSDIMEVTPEEKPLLFLSKVIADYNYYTQ